jgi:hypothetical protein
MTLSDAINTNKLDHSGTTYPATSVVCSRTKKAKIKNKGL